MLSCQTFYLSSFARSHFSAAYSFPGLALSLPKPTLIGPVDKYRCDSCYVRKCIIKRPKTKKKYILQTLMNYMNNNDTQLKEPILIVYYCFNNFTRHPFFVIRAFLAPTPGCQKEKMSLRVDLTENYLDKIFKDIFRLSYYGAMIF